MSQSPRRWTRRQILQGMGLTATGLWLGSCASRSQKKFDETTIRRLEEWNPIQRGINPAPQTTFSGDDPERAHRILRGPRRAVPAPIEKVPLVIVGGGVSGLWTGYYLRDLQPVILEQAARFGGNSKGESWNGIDYALGAAYFGHPEPGSPQEMAFADLGLTDRYRLRQKEDPVLLNGHRFERFWDGFTVEPPERKQFQKLKSYFVDTLHGKNGRSLPAIPIEDASTRAAVDALDRISFRTHLEKIAGGPLHPQIATLLEHYCWSSFGASISEISAVAGLNFYVSEFAPTCVLPGGNAAIAEALLKKLSASMPLGNLRPSSMVYDVSVTKNGVVVAYEDGNGQNRSILARTVVMACPKFVVGKILQGIEPERAAAIARLRYRSYVVGNVMIKGALNENFYDMYLLGNGRTDLSNVQKAARQQLASDVILGTFAKFNKEASVLSLYRAYPYDGARAELFAPSAFENLKKEFEQQILSTVLPALNISKDRWVDLRLSRWGHPLPVSGVGLIADGIIDQIRKPFADRVFFVEQDNWALPAHETAFSEAHFWAPAIRTRCVHS